MLLIYSGLLAASNKVARRIIVTIGTNLAVLPAGQEGTGKKAIILFGGEVKQQATTEGIVLVWDGSNLRAFNSAIDALVV